MNDKSVNDKDDRQLSEKRVKFSIGYLIAAIVIMTLIRTFLFAPLSALSQAGVRCATVEHRTDDVLSAADAVITASGTATVQAALHGCPMVIVYRLSPLTYRLGVRFVRVDTYGMVNLVAGRRVVAELIQDGFTAQAAAEECASLLTDAAKAQRVRDDLREVRRRLGGGGASDRAAAAVLAVARGETPVRARASQ